MESVSDSLNQCRSELQKQRELNERLESDLLQVNNPTPSQSNGDLSGALGLGGINGKEGLSGLNLGTKSMVCSTSIHDDVQH